MPQFFWWRGGGRNFFAQKIIYRKIFSEQNIKHTGNLTKQGRWVYEGSGSELNEKKSKSAKDHSRAQITLYSDMPSGLLLLLGGLIGIQPALYSTGILYHTCALPNWVSC
jgi:hypothetical protein